MRGSVVGCRHVDFFDTFRSLPLEHACVIWCMCLGRSSDNLVSGYCWYQFNAEVKLRESQSTCTPTYWRQPQV